MRPSHAESICSDGEYGVFEGSVDDEVVHGHYRREGTWSPEIQELLEEAGFSEVTVYWEGTDEKNNEGDGIYKPATVGDADPGWVCYIVAQR